MKKNEPTAVILAVDDRRDNLHVIRQLIEDRLPDVDVLLTTKPEEGLAMAVEYCPDGILLDLKMPGINGIDMCKRLKSDKRTAHIPIILITAGDTTPKLRAKGLDAGADDFIPKPIDNVELAARIKVILRIKRAEDALRKMNENLEKRVEEKSGALAESEKKFRQLVETMREGMTIVDENGINTYVNDQFCMMTGYAGEEVVGRPVPDFLAEESREVWRERWSRRRTPEEEPYELCFLRKDGKKIYVVTSPRALFDGQGRFKGSFAVITDITGRKLAEEKIKASLREKEVLLQEIHHRVKNNMAVISGMLNLQAASFKDPDVIGAFESSKQRIRSMAMVHEKLYGAGDFSQIDFNDYIPDLVNRIARSNDVSARNIRWDVRVNDISLAIDTAVPCGLIINELVTNAFKYAFPDGRKGEIHIEFSRDADRSCVLEIRDTGVGLPPGFDLEDTSSFGLYLVNLLCQQLNGKLEVDGSGGTSVKITFP